MKRKIVVLWTLAKVAIVALLLSWGVLKLRKLDPRLGIALPSWRREESVAHFLGLILIASGSSLILICGAILSTRGVLRTPGDRLFPREFTTVGPFRYTRNPMSLGIVALTFGLGFYTSSVSILLFALVLFFALHMLVTCVEEPGLEKRFGESYRAYKRAVDRWLPSLRAKNF